MNFEDAMTVVAKIDQMAEDLKAKLRDAIGNLAFDGTYINDGSNGGPIIATLRLSSVLSNWSPSFHIPKDQAEAVFKHLSHFNTATGSVGAVRGILLNGFVPDGGSKIHLNPNTMTVIRESELGQYVLSHMGDAVNE